jgi:hypothetical protein
VLWGIIKVIPVFKQISSEAMDSQELLWVSYMLHGAEVKVSTLFECNRTRWVQSLEKCHLPELCTHHMLLTLHNKCKWWHVEQLGPKMVTTKHILTFYSHYPF